MTNLPGSQYIIEVLYFVAAALFILSLKWLSSPATARRGIFAGEAGMLLAIVGTLFHHGIVDFKWIAIALVLGTIIGVPLGNVAMRPSEVMTPIGPVNQMNGALNGRSTSGWVIRR